MGWPWEAQSSPRVARESWGLLILMSIDSVMPSNHLILCYPLLLLPSIFPSIKVFSNELVLCLPQRRVVWMWFGAFPGAFGLGRAQPQRRGASPCAQGVSGPSSSCVWNPRVFADDARGWQCPFVLCLHH